MFYELSNVSFTPLLLQYFTDLYIFTFIHNIYVTGSIRMFTEHEELEVHRVNI